MRRRGDMRHGETPRGPWKKRPQKGQAKPVSTLSTFQSCMTPPAKDKHRRVAATYRIRAQRRPCPSYATAHDASKKRTLTGLSATLLGEVAALACWNGIRVPPDIGKALTFTHLGGVKGPLQRGYCKTKDQGAMSCTMDTCFL
ncbi:hypothetical protein CI238_10030 [Colletotrichum incanum]|uniref:Uncharacterized protein n=1 Tax=Colletotrichum incanum TaxID=1573173 RepID=A0A166RZR3_COLIC|nr:hypothetical protein CI238_10030 [Colletotrichum incanum]